MHACMHRNVLCVKIQAVVHPFTISDVMDKRVMSKLRQSTYLMHACDESSRGNKPCSIHTCART